MSRVRWGVAAGAVLLLAAGWWWLGRGAARRHLSARIAELRASGAVFTLAERCAGHARGAQDFTVWAARLAEALDRVPSDATDHGETLLEFELEPLTAWRKKGWTLDEASWELEGPLLEQRARENEEVCAVFRTIGEYDAVDPCSLVEGLEPPRWHPEH